MSPERDATAKGWPARKFYLSPEAIELLEGHCKGTPLTMSAYLDILIKQNLGEPERTAPPPDLQAALHRKARAQEPPAVSAERAKKAALDRGIAEARRTLAAPKPMAKDAVPPPSGHSTKKDQPFDL